MVFIWLRTFTEPNIVLSMFYPVTPLCIRDPSWLWSYCRWIYSYLCNQCLSPLMWAIISIRAKYTTLCDKVCQWLATGRWFSPGPPVSFTNKTDQYAIILLKVILNTIKQATTKHLCDSVLNMCRSFSVFTYIYVDGEIWLSRRVVISLTSLTPHHLWNHERILNTFVTRYSLRPTGTYFYNRSLLLSEWVIVFKRQHRNCSAISWREQVTFRWDADDGGRFVLDQQAR